MRKTICLLMSILLIAGLTGCNDKASNVSEKVTTNKQEQNVAIHAGKTDIFIDEAKYYAYTAQATYETYYIAQNKEIDWNGKMTEDVTWQQGIKSTVLDDICRRTCMYEQAKKYNVTLSGDEQKIIDTAVNEYFAETSAKLQNKIGISKARLKELFQKTKISEKVEATMNKDNKNGADKMYENWKLGNDITAEKQWENINFEKHVFTLEDAK